jgi:hypothetical protein
MTEEGPPKISVGFGVFSEAVGTADLEILNAAIKALRNQLRDAKTLFDNSADGGRDGAVVAISALWNFLMRFEPILDEALQWPLMRLHGALLALDQNNVEPILRPKRGPRGGRPPDSPARLALIGIAVGTVRRLELTGMSLTQAHKAVANALSRLGVTVSIRKIRDWCERVDADVGRHSDASTNADMMLTEKWRSEIRGLPPLVAQKRVLGRFTNSVRRLRLDRPRELLPLNAR